MKHAGTNNILAKTRDSDQKRPKKKGSSSQRNDDSSCSIEPKITMRNCYIFIVVKCQNETDAGTLNENGPKKK